MKTPILLSSIGIAALYLTGCETGLVATRPVYQGGGVVYQDQERGPYAEGVIYRDGRYYRGDRVVYYDDRDRRYYDYDRRNQRDNDRRDVTVVNVRNPQNDRNDRHDQHDWHDQRDSDRPNTVVVRTPQKNNEPHRVTARQPVEKVQVDPKKKKTKKKTDEEKKDGETEGQYQRQPR